MILTSDNNDLKPPPPKKKNHHSHIYEGLIIFSKDKIHNFMLRKHEQSQNMIFAITYKIEKVETDRTRDLGYHTSRISSVGICGRKSLPTKKHMKIKSSRMHSKSISKGGLGILNSYSRYSLKVQMLRNYKRNMRGENQGRAILSQTIYDKYITK